MSQNERLHSERKRGVCVHAGGYAKLHWAQQCINVSRLADEPKKHSRWMVGRKRILMMLNINSINSKTVRFASVKIKLVVLSLVHGKISWNACRRFIWTLRCWRGKKSKGHIMRAPQIFQLSPSFLQRLQKLFLAGWLCGSVVTVTLTESNQLLWKIRLFKRTSL